MMYEHLLEIARQRADKMISEMVKQGGELGYPRYPILTGFRWDVCETAFVRLSNGSSDCCRSSEIINTLKGRYGGGQSEVLWQDKKCFIWRPDVVHFVLYKKKNDQIFSCFRNGVNRHRARSLIFASKLYPQGCSPDTIIDVLLAYDKSLIAIDCDYDRVLNGYMSIKNKLRVIQQILLTAESADSD